MRILGIDPGFGRIGWGVVEVSRHGAAPVFLACGCIETEAREDFANRLMEISHAIQKLCSEFKPGSAGIEKLYFAKNTKTAMQVAEARGVILLALASAGIMIKELTPLQVKQGITGCGSAGKNQVGAMVKILLKLKQIPKLDDTADALGIAIVVSAMH